MTDRPSPTTRLRNWFIAAIFILAAIAGLVALATFFDGPMRWSVAGWTISNRTVSRPAWIALSLWLAGMTLFGWRLGLMRVVGARPSTLSALIAAATMAVGLNYASTVAAGSDAYGYVNQADLWLKGELTIDQSWAAPVPWPDARWSFAPLGTRPSNLERWHIVPMYPPGLPLLMAGAKSIGGQEAVFWVVPLAGALLVLATYGIGRRLASPYAALIGAWLVATSPAFVFMLTGAMSDVPVAAACAGSFYFMLERRRRSAIVAGLAIGLGIAIRPNLAPLVGIMGLWYLVPFIRPGRLTRGETFLQGVLFSIGAMAGAAVIAAFHQHLNGSPFISTYGRMDGAFAAAHFWPNVKLYTGWLVESQTPVVLVGVAALLLPLRRLWPAAGERLAFVVIGLFVLAMWLMYCFYLVFDAWWFLRFLLPTWPFFMVGLGAVFVFIWRRGGQLATSAVITAVMVLGIYQVKLGVDLYVFALWKGERRYVSAAREVRRMTDRTSAIFSMQHSSSIRYYGGRVSIRYDGIEPHWIDRSVDWLAERGIHSYLLVDDWEIPGLKERFAGRRFVERLDDRPLLHYQGGSQVYLYDLSGPRDPLRPTVFYVDTFKDTRSVEPVTMAPLEFEPPR